MFSERRCGSSRPREMRAAENRKLILRTIFSEVLNFYAQFGVPSAPFRTDPSLSSMWTSSVEKTSPRKSLSNSFFVFSFSSLLPSSGGGGRGVSLTTSLLRHADAAARAERAYVRTAALESFSLPNRTAEKTTLSFFGCTVENGNGFPHLRRTPSRPCWATPPRKGGRAAGSSSQRRCGPE